MSQQENIEAESDNHKVFKRLIELCSEAEFRIEILDNSLEIERCNTGEMVWCTPFSDENVYKAVTKMNGYCFDCWQEDCDGPNI